MLSHASLPVLKSCLCLAVATRVCIFVVQHHTAVVFAQLEHFEYQKVVTSVPQLV